jgi:hypothetical protein
LTCNKQRRDYVMEKIGLSVLDNVVLYYGTKKTRGAILYGTERVFNRIVT